MTFKTNLSFLLVNTCMNDKYPWNYHKTKQGTIWSQKCCSQSLLDLISLDQNSSNIISLHICIAHFILNSNGFLSNNCSPKWRVFFCRCATEVSTLQCHMLSVCMATCTQRSQTALIKVQYLFCDSVHTFILLDPLGWFWFILGKLFSNVWTDVSPAFL